MDPRFYKSAGPLPLGSLISGLDLAPIEGDFLDQALTSIAPLASSSPGDVCFLESKSHLDALTTARATACFVTPALASHLGARHILPLITDHPRAAFARATDRLHTIRNDAPTDIHPDANIHPTAHIGPGVAIGAGTTVGPYAVITFAEIGRDCQIKAQAVIGGEGLGVAGDAAGLVSLPHVGTVRLGDRVRVGSHTCIDRALIGETLIEDDVKLDNLVQIAHNVRVGPRTIMASLTGIPGSCDIGADVRIGGQVGVADHLIIGDGATLLAKAGVMHNVPAGEVWGGIPATPARQWMRQTAMLRKMLKRG